MGNGVSASVGRTVHVFDFAACKYMLSGSRAVVLDVWCVMCDVWLLFTLFRERGWTGQTGISVTIFGRGALRGIPAYHTKYQIVTGGYRTRSLLRSKFRSSSDTALDAIHVCSLSWNTWGRRYMNRTPMHAIKIVQGLHPIKIYVTYIQVFRRNIQQYRRHIQSK